MPIDWAEFPTANAGPGAAAEFPESGWGALLCWIAGPDNVEKVLRASGDVGVTRVEVVTGGVATRSARPASLDERSAVDDSIDEYLAEAGVPPRPRGHRWYARSGAPSPAAWSRAVRDAIEAGGRPADPRRVRELGERAALALKQR